MLIAMSTFLNIFVQDYQSYDLTNQTNLQVKLLLRKASYFISYCYYLL